MAARWCFLLLALCACRVSGEFTCETSEQCVRGAAIGICEARHVCSFPDALCPSGARYDGTAGELAGVCVGMEPGRWNAPALVLAGYSDPSLTDDMLELYASKGTDIFMARRSSTSDAWPIPTQVNELSQRVEGSPEVSGDGLTIYFAVYEFLNGQIWRATRGSRSEPWSGLVEVVELNTDMLETGAAPAADGEALVLGSSRSGNLDVLLSTRAGPVWSAPAAIAEVNTPADEGAPFLTADQRELYFISDRGGASADLYVATRASRDDPFDAPVALVELDTTMSESGAWVSRDGHHLFFGRAGSAGDAIYEATR